MAKYHFLTGDDLLAMDETERVARCVAIKAEIVSSDEREGGRRALLNYGHTLAHALEIETDHALAHGEAVAVGLVYAADLAHRLGRIDADRVRQHYDVVGGELRAGDRPARGTSTTRVWSQLMGRDKKALGDRSDVRARRQRRSRGRRRCLRRGCRRRARTRCRPGDGR